MGPLIASLLCVLPRWRLWQNCHFRHICQIRRFRQLLWAPFTALCFASLAIVAKLSFSPYLPNSPFSPTFMGPLYCFVLCLVGDCGKIVIFAIFAKFAAFANVYGAPFTALCFASLAIVAKLSFSPYLPNSPLSPTFMGPLHCFVLCLVGDCGKIVIFAIFAKFAIIISFLQFLLLCAFLDISHFSSQSFDRWDFLIWLLIGLKAIYLQEVRLCALALLYPSRTSLHMESNAGLRFRTCVIQYLHK